MISIVIPVFNQLAYTLECVQSIRAHTHTPYRLILVDNGSTEPVAETFQNRLDVTFVRSEKNLGFAGGVNLGLAEATGHVLLLNNDTLVPEGWLEGLERALLQAPDIGMVGPMSNWVSGSQLIPDLTFENLDDINAFALARRSQYPDSLRDVARLVGFCLLIRDVVVADVGPLDEAFGLGNFEDDDYCVRVLRAGYRLCVDEGSFVFHYGNRTFQSLGIRDAAWESLIETNAARFGAKWDLKPEDRLDACRESLRINQRAADALGRGDLVDALRHYRDAIACAPNLARNHNDLAVALWQAGMADQAYRRLQMALRMDPGYVAARENLRDMSRAMGCEADAEMFLTDVQKETAS